MAASSWSTHSLPLFGRISLYFLHHKLEQVLYKYYRVWYTPTTVAPPLEDFETVMQNEETKESVQNRLKNN